MADCSLASSNRNQWRLENGSNLPHWAENFYGYRLNIIPRYDTDRNQSKRRTAMLLRLVGQPRREPRPAVFTGTCAGAIA